MTERMAPPWRRGMVPALLLVLGAAVVIATWIGGQHSLALVLAAFYLICFAVAWVWAGRGGDVAALLRSSGDERQRQLDVRATAFAGVISLLFCLGGTVVDLARGGTGNPWASICAVGGASYALSLAYLRRRG